MSDFSLALGYKTGGGLRQAVDHNTVTEQVVLAAEGLLARRMPATVKPVRLLVTISPDGLAESVQVRGEEEATIGGRQFLMIPQDLS